MRLRTRPLALLAISALLTLLAAVSAFAAELTAINVAYVKAPFNLPSFVARELGLLEKEFGADGIQVNYHEITSGAKQTQAMAAGSLDFASVINSTSVLLANAGGNPVRIVGGYSRPVRVFALMAKDPAIRSVRDLRGKKVAGPKGTVLHQMLAAALARENMAMDEVEFIFMNIPYAMTALLAGSVDAALLAASTVMQAEQAGAHVVTTAEGLVRPTLVIAVPERFLKTQGAIVHRYLKVHAEAVAYMRNHLEEALEIGAQAQGISVADARRLYEWTEFITHLTADDLRSMEGDQEFMLANGMMVHRVDLGTVVAPIAME